MLLRDVRLAPCALLALAACTGSSAALDGRDDVAVPGGKADDSAWTACQLDAVVAFLNDGATVDAAALEAAGLDAEAARGLVAHRDGADALFATADDDLFDDIAEVDAVDFVGVESMRALVAAAPAAVDCPPPPPPVDHYAQARDVTLAVITFAADAPAPESYAYPRAEGFSLGGTEFWQRWSGGHSPTFSFSEGTPNGRRCMQAAAIRWETLMADPPTELVRLRDESNWSGSFFNWNDDHTMAAYDGSGARLWAWRTHLVKFISQTNRDGSCNLPTREQLERLVTRCLETAAANGGEIQGCSANAR